MKPMDEMTASSYK